MCIYEHAIIYYTTSSSQVTSKPNSFCGAVSAEVSIAEKKEKELREELTCRAAWSEQDRRTCGEQTEQQSEERGRGVSEQHPRRNSQTTRDRKKGGC